MTVETMDGRSQPGPDHYAWKGEVFIDPDGHGATEWTDEEMQAGLRAYDRIRKGYRSEPMTPAELGAYRAYKRVAAAKHKYLVVEGLDVIPDHALDKALERRIP